MELGEGLAAGGDDDDWSMGMEDNVQMLLAMLQSSEKSTVGMGSDDAKGAKGSGGGVGGFVKVEDKSDKLNLSGVLNVLDGVVDCPNRIVVMTSNHPEKLDPALIRPGRVNLKLFLGYIELPEACEMISLYFGAPPSAADEFSGCSRWTSPRLGPGAVLAAVQPFTGFGAKSNGCAWRTGPRRAVPRRPRHLHQARRQSPRRPRRPQRSRLVVRGRRS